MAKKAGKPAATVKSAAAGQKDRSAIAAKARNRNEAGKAAVARAHAPAPKSAAKPPPQPQQESGVPAAAVPTDGKPRKNEAGLSPREREFFRDLLLAKRREILGDMDSMETEALSSVGGSNLSNLPIHMADMGTDNYEQEFTIGLVEKDRKLIREINVALGKIQNGTYGICEGTGKPISKARLEAQPWARYSIEYARKIEGHMR